MTDNRDITLCICTFRREHIADTLRSVASLHVNPTWNLHVIVADNDDTLSARNGINAVACETGLKLNYIHAPARNISVARNACLDAAATQLVAFIDDDECVTPAWLKAMVAAIDKSGADVVLGPVQAIYDPAMPAWMRQGDFHSTRPVWVEGRILTGYSCNVMLRREIYEKQKLRFRKELGRSGGEDTVFFTQIVRAGGTIAFAPEAVVTEAVTPERATLRWLLKRRFRAGQTHGLLLLESGDSLSLRIKQILKAGGKYCFCVGMALLCILSPLRMHRWLLRGALHMGVVARMLGKQEITQYG